MSVLSDYYGKFDPKEIKRVTSELVDEIVYGECAECDDPCKECFELGIRDQTLEEHEEYNGKVTNIRCRTLLNIRQGKELIKYLEGELS